MSRRLLILLYSVMYCFIVSWMGLIAIVGFFIYMVTLYPTIWVITGKTDLYYVDFIQSCNSILAAPLCKLGEHDYPEFVYQYDQDELGREYISCNHCKYRKYV